MIASCRVNGSLLCLAVSGSGEKMGTPSWCWTLGVWTGLDGRGEKMGSRGCGGHTAHHSTAQVRARPGFICENRPSSRPPRSIWQKANDNRRKPGNSLVNSSSTGGSSDC